MTTSENPRARLDAALEEMRSTIGSSSQPVRLTAEATVACAEALSLLVDAHLAAVKPKPDPRESLPDDTPVGHGWVALLWDLFKPDGNGRLTWWLEDETKWGASRWEKRDLPGARPATVGDLRRRGVPVSEWPDITAPDLPPEPPLDESVVLVKGDAYQRHNYGDWFGVLDEHSPRTWAELCRRGTPTVIYTPEEAP